MYEIPDGLPMPYETNVPGDDDNDEDVQASDNRAVLFIDSPLANDPSEACLEVEVIGIFPDPVEDTDGKQSCQVLSPTMAMVALKKRKASNGGNSVSQGLFEASEKRIIQSLDRGLQDLEEGRLSIPSSYLSDDGDDDSGSLRGMDEFDDLNDDGIDAAIKRMGYKNSIDAATTVDVSFDSETKNKKRQQQSSLNIDRDGMGIVGLESIPIKPKENAKKRNSKASVNEPKAEISNQQLSAPSKDTPQPKAQTQAPKDVDSEDYAIKMARQQAETLMTTATIGSTTSATQGTVAISGGESDFAILAAKKAAERLKSNPSIDSKALKGASGNTSQSKILPNKVWKEAEAQNLSNDEMFLKLQSFAKTARRKLWNSTISKKKDGEEMAPHKKEGLKATATSTTSKVQPSPVTKTDDQIRDDITKVTRENKMIQEMMRSATGMMQTEQEGEEGLSPEEMLAQVLKFGDEKEKEESPGYGFVEGAFGKAKDLLCEEEITNPLKDLKYKDMDSSKEEELKRIFATGESLAQDKLAMPRSHSPNIATPSITEEDIDALIDADNTVPRNARVLDEEFAELEVRMSRSEGEDTDGPSNNKMFDVFSGPEVYNPNVDPATAVNWPGAKDGTRTDVQLATELSTALKQAKFASTVLSQIREEEGDDEVRYFVGDKEVTLERLNLLRKCVNEAVKAGIIDDPELVSIERSRLQMLVDELLLQPEERLEEIALNYKDLLLSDNLVDLIRERLYAMAQRDLDAQCEGNEDAVKKVHDRERAIMINLAQIAQGLVKEAQALGAELEVSMLEIIRSICEVAMDPSHKTEEDTAVALSEAVRDMRPLLDDAFVAYLKYAIAEEEGKLAREGVVDDPEHNRWLFVLKIVQEGVYAELSQGVKRHIDHIWYVLRMNSKTERKELLEELISVMPTMDVRPFVKVVSNIVSSLGTSVKGDFADGLVLGEMTNKLLQLQSDVNDVLPPERIKELSKDADAWAAKQRQRLFEQQNLTRQRLEAARQTGSVDPDKEIKKLGAEYERFD